MSGWRDDARKVIAGVVTRVGTSDGKRLKRELRAAYPFGQREHYPYTIWLEEQRRVLGELESMEKYRAGELDLGPLFDGST